MSKKTLDVYCPYCGGGENEIEINDKNFEKTICCNWCGDDFKLEYNTETAILKISGMIYIMEDQSV